MNILDIIMSKTIGKYTILRTLGSGGSCKVKLAENTADGNKKVAVKIMNDDMGQEEKALLKNEVEIMCALNHQNVVNYLEWGQDDYKKSKGSKVVDYIALELAGKGELFDFISNSGPFSEPVARYYFKQFMVGLDYVHKAGVTHRDLKPENLLLDK